MADNANHDLEETKEEAAQDNQQELASRSTREDIVNELVEILNYLFEPNNLSNNAYLIQRSQGVTFHIPVKYIYEENSIRAKTGDIEIINEAIEQAENVVANKKGDVIDTVKPKNDQLRKNITVKGIAKDDEIKLKQLVYEFEGAQDAIANWNLNSQLNILTIVCQDEQYAIDLFHHLQNIKFKDAPLDCSLNFENLYIIALENMKNRNKLMPGYQQAGYPQGFSQGGFLQRPYMMAPQYQMQALFLNQMSNNYFKNLYSPPNFYMQNPGMDRNVNPMHMQMNPNINGYQNRSQNQYSRGGGGGGGRRGGGWGKKPRGGGRGGKYHKNGGYNKPSGNEQAKVKISDSDFPPLSNENPSNQ